MPATRYQSAMPLTTYTTQPSESTITTPLHRSTAASNLLNKCRLYILVAYITWWHRFNNLYQPFCSIQKLKFIKHHTHTHHICNVNDVTSRGPIHDTLIIFTRATNITKIMSTVRVRVGVLQWKEKAEHSTTSYIHMWLPISILL